jgi:hypothetical protein
MGQFWRATAVTTTSGSDVVQVVTGDDVALISPNSFLQVGANQFVEVKTVNTTASPQTIELYYNWNGATASGQNAIAAPTKAEIKEAAAEIRALRVVYEGLADTVAVTNTADSIVKRDAAGRIKATNPVAAQDVVTKDYLGTAAVLDATSSATDTNSNKLSKVGDFGAGALITTDYPISNIDIVTGVGGGMYRYINTNTGTFPSGFSGFGNIWVNKYDANNASQILVDLNGKSAFRHVNNDVPSGWNINFTSGNSVNPLDFGLGADNSRNAEITDCDTVKVAGFYTVSPSATNRPAGTPANNTKLVVLGGSFGSRATQIFSNDAVSVSSIWVRNYNAAWSDWQEIFHSGNSVNTLDYGLQTAVTLSASDNLDTLVETKIWFNPTASYAPSNNYPIASAGSLFVIARNSSNVTQEFVKYADNVLSQKWFRSKGTVGWSDWQEIYHSGNTNFDTWKSAAVGDILCTGEAISSTTIRFFIDTDFVKNPNGIDVLAGKTFSLATSVDAIFASNITTLNFNGRSTPKQLIFDVTTSGLTTDKTYQLRSEQSDSQFKATF